MEATRRLMHFGGHESINRFFTWLLYAAISASIAWLVVNAPGPYLGFALIIVAAIARQRAFVLAAGAVGLMIDSAHGFRSVVYFEDLGVPVMVTLLAGTVLWMSLRLHGPGMPILSLPLPGARARTAVRYSQAHAGIFMLGVIALVELIHINRTPEAIAATIDTQYGLLVVGIALIIAGLGGVRLPYRLKIDWRSVLPVLIIMAVALFLRFWQLGTSARFFIDEVLFSNSILYMWQVPYISLTIPFDGVAAEPLLFPYWQSLAVEAFGRNFVGLRAASAILGTLTIPAIYVLGRALFDRKTAVAAALLLATFPPHIHFSRIGLSEIAMAFFGTLALAFLARGIISNRRFDYAFGGAMLGMTHYFHEGGKYLYTPVAVLWLAGLLIFFRSRLSIKNLVVAAVAFLLVALPIYAGLLLANKPLAARMVYNSAGLNGDYWRELFASGNFAQHIQDHVLPPFLIYIQHPETTLFYGGDSALMVSVVPAFLLGVFYVLWRWKTPGPMLLLIWVLFTSLGNTLLVESAAASRYVVVFPALMLLAAVGVRYTLPLLWPEVVRIPNHYRIVSWIKQRLPLRAASSHTLVLMALVIGLSVYRVDYYFNKHLPAYNQEFRETSDHRDAEDVVIRSLDFPPGTQIHIISRVEVPDYDFINSVLGFLADDLELYIPRPTTVMSKYIASLDTSVNHAFFVGPFNTTAIALLSERFDLQPPQLSPYADIPADEQFVLYYAPAPGGDPPSTEAASR